MTDAADDGAVFDPSRRFTFLEDGGQAPTAENDESFWRELMSGAPSSPEVARIANGAGWLFGVYSIEADTTHWERHPAGDELLVALTASMALVLEMEDGERTVELTPGLACLVPRGVWHRQIVRTAGTYLGATYGKGSEHRPLAADEGSA